mmetsp:Transcript_2723/g.8003  ORF Transcript_2723/g.8003 Transcript_2723/m.8003 type:complete len:380 (-) Transcript_2723:77-1216(-)
MLGGDGVRDADRFFQRVAGDREAARAGGRRDGFGRQDGELRVERFVDRPDGLLGFLLPALAGREGDDDRPRDDVVLGLRQHVRRDHVGVARLVAQHQDLGGPREHVDADARVRHRAGLRRRDPGVAGAADDVRPRHALAREGARGERRDRVRAADSKEVVRARHVRRRERHGQRLGGRDDDGVDARRARGRGRHDDGRRQRVAAARRVAARDFDRLDRVARLAAGDVRLGVSDRRALRLREVLHARRDAVEAQAVALVQALVGRLHLVLGDHRALALLELAEPRGVRRDGGRAFGFDFLQALLGEGHGLGVEGLRVAELDRRRVDEFDRHVRGGEARCLRASRGEERGSVARVVCAGSSCGLQVFTRRANGCNRLVSRQ